MHVNDNWWERQLWETAKEVFRLLEKFRATEELDFVSYGKAYEFFEEIQDAYSEMRNMNIQEFIELGKCLRDRQAFPSQGHAYGSDFSTE